MKNIFTKVFITAFMVFLSFNQGALAKSVKFIQITDSHFNTEGIMNNGLSNSQIGLENAIKDINGIAKVDFVVFTGDNIDKANPSELKKFLKEANKLNVPYYVVIGNHEVYKSQKFCKVDYMKMVRRYSKNCRARKANYVFKKNGFVFIVLDGTKEVIPGPSGYFKPPMLKWFDKKLTKYRHSNVIVLQHFPIVAPVVNRSHTTYAIDSYKKVLSKHNNVIAIISGHYHTNGEQMVDGIYHISSPALVEPPHNFKIIEIETVKGQRPQVYTQLRHYEQ